MFQTKEVINREQLDRYIEEAARVAGYEDGFGVKGCDLTKPIWWAAYVRQSLEEQAKNNRVPEYLLTCARLAKEKSVIVPIEYIVIDHESSDYLDRKHMLFLRKELIEKRRIKGVIIPEQGRLSGNSLHQQIFEAECNYYGVEFLFGDAPSGTDWASAAARQLMAHANQLRLQTTHKAARGGNIGRVLKGMVPAHRAAYGYRYRREAELTPDGKVYIKHAWWEIDDLGPDGKPLSGSPAWVVIQIFAWVGDEGRTLHWVANQLNERGIKTADGGRWSPNTVAKIAHRQCYSGNHTYNVNSRVPNPNKPLGDITAEIKRTLLRPKPQQEWVNFQIPPLVSEDLCRKARENLVGRGRGRGKQGRSIQSLLRNRLFCPRCGKPMVVRRDGRQNRVYYHCSKYFHTWAEQPCNYRRFIPGSWDELIWQDVSTWLRDDAWVEQQVTSEQSQDENLDKLVRLQQLKIFQSRAKIAKVQEGFEGSIYGLDEARKRIADLQQTIAKAEEEIQRLQETVQARRSSTADINVTREELKALRDRNLDATTFEEKLDIVSRLGIKVYPSEDLKSMRVLCELNLDRGHADTGGSGIESKGIRANVDSDSAIECRKVTIGPPVRTTLTVSRGLLPIGPHSYTGSPAAVPLVCALLTYQFFSAPDRSQNVTDLLRFARRFNDYSMRVSLQSVEIAIVDWPG
jgi:hypothetical protein